MISSLLSSAFADQVISFPPNEAYITRVYNLTREQFVASGKRVYNHTGATETIMVVADDWPYMPIFLAEHQVPHNWESLRHRPGRARRSDSHSDLEYPVMRLVKTIRRDVEDDVQDYIDGLTESLTLSWGLDRIDHQSKVLDSQYLGYLSGVSNLRTVHLYVVDTGVFQHSNFDGTVSYDFSSFPSDPADCNGTASENSLRRHAFQFSPACRSRNPCRRNSDLEDIRSGPISKRRDPFDQGPGLQWPG